MAKLSAKSSPGHLPVKFTSNPSICNNPFEKVVFLFGPTGVGKTELLLDLDPKKFSVVNADSIQVYRYLDIGSAKASPQTLETIPHYLIDIFDPWQQFSVGDFVAYADEACKLIHLQGKIPIVSGGTAYYFKHFLYGLSEAPPSNDEIRLRLTTEIAEKGDAWAYSRLRLVDPIAAERIHPSDMYRVSRALEVFETSGRPLSSFSIPSVNRNGMNPLVIGLKRENEELKRRIKCRVQQMFSEGLVEEIRSLLDKGASSAWPGLQGIGYKEFFQAMESGECSLSMIADQIERNSRFYAKRQMTFFKSFTDVRWMDPSDKEPILSLIEAYQKA
ncbi:MAG: tRNA (adenosine(37)-N6)-dimethylallyltransferase MiaA [Spirochaetia bacterium]|nr:tRNA (adenosine(37)-N6)-dimethylallyltransferase MiaA [Spirochaetia bacterium]